MLKLINLTFEQCKTELSKFKNAGFDGVDLALYDGVMNDGWEKRIDETAQLLENNNMVCAQVHLPFYDLFDSSEKYNEKTESQIKNSFKAMSILGAKWGALHPQSSTGFGYDRNRSMHDNIEKIKGYLEEAVKYNTGIAVENIPVFPDCPQYKFFTANSDDHIELVDSLDSDFVKICWDFGHSNLMNYNITEILKKLGDRIKILHIHNNNGICDWHVTPSIGTIKWDDIAKKHSVK